MSDKWVIEKCRRGRRCWHVYGPTDVQEDECVFGLEYEFRSGAAAIAFVDERLSPSRMGDL